MATPGETQAVLLDRIRELAETAGNATVLTKLAESFSLVMGGGKH